MQINPNSVRKLLLVRNDRFGEFLLNIPAFRALKEYFSDASLTLIVNPYVKELAQTIDCVNKVIVWNNIKHKFGEIFKFSRVLKKEKFDICVIFNPSGELNMISFLAGIPVRFGYSNKLGFLLTRTIKDEKKLGERHEIDYNLELAAVTGANINNKSLYLAVNDNLAVGLLNEIGVTSRDILIALHPWTSDPVKQWPLNYFCALAKRIAAELNVKLLVIGGGNEREKSRELFQDLGDRVINITGKTSLTQLAAILKKCSLVISSDSGPAHLACAVKTPVLAIFRNDIPGKTPKRWGPWGEGHNMVIEKNRLCDISVDEVLNKAKGAVEKGMKK